MFTPPSVNETSMGFVLSYYNLPGSIYYQSTQNERISNLRLELSSSLALLTRCGAARKVAFLRRCLPNRVITICSTTDLCDSYVDGSSSVVLR